MCIGKLASSSLLAGSEGEQDCVAGPFVKLRSLAAGAVLGVAVAAAWGIIPAGAVTATGIAVGSVGSSTPVGTISNGLFLPNAIQYFIPLHGVNGIYGTGLSCSNGFGTCSNTGKGGGLLTMILRFSPVSTTTISTLSVIFEDLDLKNANDPAGFLEKLNVVTASGASLTGGWIKTIGGLITGNANLQSLTLSLGILASDPLYLKLLFKAKSEFTGWNTPEYLIATITSPNPAVSPVPLPGAVWLMGTVLFGAAGFAKWRKRRGRVPASAA